MQFSPAILVRVPYSWGPRLTPGRLMFCVALLKAARY